MADLPVRWKSIQKAEDGRKVMCDDSSGAMGHVYHRLPWCHAKLVFENARLRLSPVRTWPDSYERWWCDGLFGRPTALAGVSAYALCWTTSRFDEPAWRMAGYGKEEPLVRLRCNGPSLLKAVRQHLHTAGGSWFLGAVRYQATARLRELARQVNDRKHKEVARTAATMLLHKRRAFSFEKEVRLLFLDRAPPRDEIFLPIDPKAIISQVMTSPYATPEQHEMVRDDLGRYGIKPLRSLVLSAPIWP